jgi:hypothetical protein
MSLLQLVRRAREQHSSCNPWRLDLLSHDELKLLTAFVCQVILDDPNRASHEHDEAEETLSSMQPVPCIDLERIVAILERIGQEQAAAELRVHMSAYMSADELLRLVDQLFGDRSDSAQNIEAERPRSYVEKPIRSGRVRPPPPPRDDPMTIIAAAGGLERVRRTARVVSVPAAIPEVRRAVSEIAARCGVAIHPTIPSADSRLVDDVCNFSPSKFAVEVMGNES